jgi:hypothetical protein
LSRAEQSQDHNGIFDGSSADRCFIRACRSSRVNLGKRGPEITSRESIRLPFRWLTGLEKDKVIMFGSKLHEVGFGLDC